MFEVWLTTSWYSHVACAAEFDTTEVAVAHQSNGLIVHGPYE